MILFPAFMLAQAVVFFGMFNFKPAKSAIILERLKDVGPTVLAVVAYCAMLIDFGGSLNWMMGGVVFVGICSCFAILRNLTPYR